MRPSTLGQTLSLEQLAQDVGKDKGAFKAVGCNRVVGKIDTVDDADEAAITHIRNPSIRNASSAPPQAPQSDRQCPRLLSQS